MKPLKLIRALFGSAPRVAAAECLDRVRAGSALLIDVREPDEWRAGVAEHAQLLPLSDLMEKRERWHHFLITHADRDLLLYCGAGVRSAMATRVLRKEGFRATNAGSLAEWTKAGWKILRPDVS